ncbi:MAG: hypothetical protein PHR28_05620 [candidate division Zixibacteria bacterium]|nr:hypothetical protein [candidate division Zixibacteria bacterium]
MTKFGKSVVIAVGAIIVLGSLLLVRGDNETLTGSYAELFKSINDTIDWTKYESNAVDTVKTAIMKQMEAEQITVNDPSDQILERTHLMDIDADGIDDIIFNGFTGSGAESEIILICRRTERGLQTALKAWGRITGIYRISPWGPVGFRVFAYGCCGATDDYVEDYYSSLYCGMIKYQLASRILIERQTPLPRSFYLKGKPFQIPRDGGKLRYGPVVDDEVMEDEDHRIAHGNVLVDYSISAAGIVLGEEVDSLGMMWEFVLMNSDAKPTWEFYTDHRGGNSEERARIVGWIEAPYLR